MMEVSNCDDLSNINARIAYDNLREWLARAEPQDSLLPSAGG